MTDPHDQGQQPPQYGQQQPQYGQPPQPYDQPGPQAAPRLPDGTTPKWAPLYGATPVQAVKRFFSKYADPSGRASRSEYWWVQLAFTLVSVVLGVLALVGGLAGETTDASGRSQPGPVFTVVAVLFLLGWLAVIVPSIMLTVRRLHDVDLSGLLWLLTFVPYLGSLVLLVLAILPSNPAGARFDKPTS